VPARRSQRAAVNGMELVSNAGVIGARGDHYRVFVLVGITGIELVIPRL
jgi:hypothetical protein